MNIPFSPAFLWPIPVALVVGGIVFERRRRKRQAKRVEPPRSEGANAPTGVRGREWMVSFFLIWLGITWSWSLWKFAVPPINGRVVDQETGAPISGVLFMRDLSRVGLLSFLSESGGGVWAAPTAKARSDRDGRFRIPGWVAVVPMGVWGLNGMSWVAYSEEYFPVTSSPVVPGFYPFLWVSLARPGMGGAQGLAERWIDTWGFGWQPLTVELRLKRMVNPGEWAYGLGQTRSLVEQQTLPGEELVKQAVRFVDRGGEITPSVRQELGKVVGALALAEAFRTDRIQFSGRRKTCPAGSPAFIGRQRLLGEVAGHFYSGDVEKGIRCLDASGDVTQAVREDLLPIAYYGGFQARPQAWPPVRTVLVHERERCARTKGLCGTRYVDWLEGEFRDLQRMHGFARAERLRDAEPNARPQ